MFTRSKHVMVAAIAIACAAMMLPAQADARGGRGGGGGGGGRGGGGGVGRSMGGGGRSFAPSGGGAAFRGNAGNFAHTPGAPGSPRWNGREWNGRGWYGGRGWGGYGWGFAIGPGYWGFGNPYWYGGFPFYYSTIPYADYTNPYYASTVDYGGYNYGTPIPQPQQQQQGANGPEDNEFFAQARAAFYAGDYQNALRNIEHAVIDMPGSQDAHQFHALVFFALGDYQKAAAVSHTVLEGGPGWNWSVLQSFYPSADLYTQQLRSLEHSISDHDQPASRFLLGYEYLMLGHLQSARRQFTHVVKTEPRDMLAKNLLAGLNTAPGMEPQGPAGVAANPVPNQALMPPNPPSGPSRPPGGQSAPVIVPQSPQGTPDLPPTPPAAAQPATPPGGNPASLVGTWKSSPAPGVTIETSLQPDGHFTWKFSEGSQGQSFSGTYTQQGDSLVLTRQDGQKMDGVISGRSNNGFRFRLKNTDPNDPGLDFAK